MNTTTKVMLPAILVASILIAAPISAYASSPDKPSEGARANSLAASLEGASPTVLANLSSSDIALLTKYGQVASTNETTTVAPDLAASQAVSGGVSPNAVGCWVATTTYLGKNVLGVTLYKTWNTGRWCSGGASITSNSAAGQGYQTYWPGWSGTGLIQQHAGIVSNQGRSFAQHAMQFQLGTPYPTQYVQPCTRVKGTTSGTNAADFACTLY